jgi:hypothetical protein
MTKKPHKHSKKIMNELCTFLGEDLDNPMCKELQRHMQDCPECQKYIDSIKLTVKVFQESNTSEPIPNKIKDDLLTKLNLKS